eukprot:Opistho-1_new@34336
MQKQLLWLCALMSTLYSSRAQDAVTAASLFLNTLSNEQKLATVFPFEGEERYQFHFVPMKREGITFNDLTVTQQQAARQLMMASMGVSGYEKSTAIMQLEEVLIELEKRAADDHYRDPGNYHISIFGVPSPTTIWGWRFEGHHISFHFSYNKQQLVAGTPAFLGSNPAIVPNGPAKGKQVLADETATAWALLQSLNPEQTAKTIFAAQAPRDILSFNNRQALIHTDEGIPYAELTAAQQELLRQLINVYVNRFTRLFADDMLKEIQAAGLDKLRFAWAGDRVTGPGHPHYYRVKGPTILIEYDNTQNNANHVHSVLRDLKHDFGGDLLLQHYQTNHQQ